MNSSYQAGTILKEYWEGAKRHQADGRPVAWVSGNVPIELFWALGIWPVYPENMPAVSLAELGQDIESLRQQAQDVKAQMEEIEARIQQMEEKA